MVRSMMNLTTLPLSFWDFALESATRILNMVPTKKVDKTPYQLWRAVDLEEIQKEEDTTPSEITSNIPQEAYKSDLQKSINANEQEQFRKQPEHYQRRYHYVRKEFSVRIMEYRNHKKRVVFIMGATATGKSRLSVDIAPKYSGEIINCDKMQVYKGLDIVTNKITESEMKGVPHHLLGEIQPELNFTAQDFCYHALAVIRKVVRSGKLPVIVGGSNSFIEALVDDPIFGFQYECCFLWLDVSLPILYSYAERRVDQMLDSGKGKGNSNGNIKEYKLIMLGS
ncbi:tRNA isopentenyltransferase [Tanacetum coccineum]